MIPVALALSAALGSLPALADEGAGPLHAALTTYGQHATYPLPTLSPEQTQHLLQGKMIKVRTPSADDAPVGAMGMVLTSLSRRALWLGSLDPHGSDHDDVLTLDLPKVGDELLRWYGFVDLPTPFSDRHFLIRTTINRTLPAETDGRMWGRSWRVEADGPETVRPHVQGGGIPGLAVDTFDAAIYTPVNQGAWLFLDLPDGRTLFAYHAAADLGGDIPDRMVTRYLFWGLDEILGEVMTKAKNMPTHYTADHAPLTGGDGNPIPAY